MTKFTDKDVATIEVLHDMLIEKLWLKSVVMKRARELARRIQKEVSQESSQIGCGYCKEELTCKDRDPKINKAKLGCKKFKHHEEK